MFAQSGSSAKRGIGTTSGSAVGYSVGEGGGPMLQSDTISFFCVLACTDGTVVGSDSRCVKRSASGIGFLDNTTKIFPIAKTKLAVIAAWRSRPGYMFPRMDLFVPDCPGRTPLALTGDFYLRMPHGVRGGDIAGDFWFCVVKPAGKRIPCDITIEAFTREGGITSNHIYAQTEQLQPGQLRCFGAPWCVEAAQEFASPDACDMAEGERRVRAMIQTMKRLSDKMPKDQQIVGGPVQIVKLERGILYPKNKP